MRHVRTICGCCRKAFDNIKVDTDWVDYCVLNEYGLKAVADVEEEVGSVGRMEFDNVGGAFGGGFFWGVWDVGVGMERVGLLGL